ncbi:MULTISPECIES: hypothetical protein [unclassified Microcoleus]|uniref:hypothetical protein n=1 Tax=unclassified Microcoleus TaxID=2642155 RepID=UPI002FCFE0FE
MAPYRFLGAVNQLDRGFEGLDRLQHSIAPLGGKSPQTVSRHPNLNGTLGRVPPGATGKASSIGDGLADCPELLKAGLPSSPAGDEPPTRERGRFYSDESLSFSITA